MKIAIVQPGGIGPSDDPRVIPCNLTLIERLVRLGHEVHAFALNGPASRRWSLFGATIHSNSRRPAGAWTLASIIAEQRRGRFGAIHAFGTRSGSVGALAARLFDAPLVLTLGGGELVSHPALAFGDQRSLRGRIGLRLAARTAAAVTTQSGFMARLAAARGIQARVVTHGVDLERWPVRPARPRISGEPLRLLQVGGLTGVKDQMTLLRAMAILKQAGLACELEIIGEGSLAPTIHRAAVNLALGSMVSFSGVMVQAELRPRFERADILVVTSVHESGPVVALEAAVAGVPTVGTQVGHLSDWAPQAAVAVAVGDAQALADAILALAADEPRRLRLAAEAQQIAVREDADHTAGVMDQIYRTVTQAAPARTIRD